MDMPHWISVQRSPHAFRTNDFKLLVLLVDLLASIYDKYLATIPNLEQIKEKKNNQLILYIVNTRLKLELNPSVIGS